MTKNFKNLLVVEFKTFLIFIFSILLIISSIFLIWYLFKINRDLVNYNIPEKLVVKFENDDNNYLVNLNDWSYTKYDWKYKKYLYDFEISTWFETTEHDMEIFKRKIYNQNNTYYFDYGLRIYNQNNKLVYRYKSPWFIEAYWSKDWKYVIARNWLVERLFQLFFSIETAHPIITIVEPETWKIRQLPIFQTNWLARIEKILWYVD
jgi:hypothetical protein